MRKQKKKKKRIQRKSERGRKRIRMWLAATEKDGDWCGEISFVLTYIRFTILKNYSHLWIGEIKRMVKLRVMMTDVSASSKKGGAWPSEAAKSDAFSKISNPHLCLIWNANPPILALSAHLQFRLRHRQNLRNAALRNRPKMLRRYYTRYCWFCLYWLTI